MADNGDASSLQSLSKHQLIDTCIRLQSRVQTLATLLAKHGVPIDHGSSTDGASALGTDRAFDFSRFKRRHVAIKLLYSGSALEGFVAQQNTENTVEHHLFKALTKTKLVESRDTSNYHRCGRTDKGVSAFGQVISLDVRCNATSGLGVFSSDNYSGNERDSSEKEELNYCKMLNRVLPPEIRCYAWSPVSNDFSARFNCKMRTYKYFFPLGNLNVEKMRIAAQFFVGEHDFRNFCKMDVDNGVTNYTRKIFSMDICDVSAQDDAYSVYVLTIKGQAFLWHQVRCMVAILFLVGEGQEEPDIVTRLLDVNNCPNKPQYCMAADFPLILFDCHYNEEDVHWIYDEETLSEVVKHLQALWVTEALKAATIKSMANALEKKFENVKITSQTDSLTIGVKRKKYVPLMKRPVCESLEDKLSKLEEKKRKKLKFNEEIEIS